MQRDLRSTHRLLRKSRRILFRTDVTVSKMLFGGVMHIYRSVLPGTSLLLLHSVRRQNHNGTVTNNSRKNTARVFKISGSIALPNNINLIFMQFTLRFSSMV